MSTQNGFSLIEAMVTLAIAAVVLSVGVPSFQTYIQNSRQATAVNDLATALQLARNTAISRRVRVTVCKSNDGASCRTGAGSGDWSQGWIIFTDPTNAGTVDAGEALLRVHGALGGNATLIGVRPTTVNRVSFKPQGMADGSVGHITYCDSRGAGQASALVISFGGQVRRAADDSGDGIVDIDGTNGTNVTCS
jgi:type IV fimbrial biogenesis protein FimT